ncbi:hypothetical protein D3C87_651180 [compost metagenome]
MKAKKIHTLFVLGALTMSLMTGCGSNSSNMVDPGYNDPGYNDPGYNDPGYNNPGYNNPGYNNPNPGYTTPVQLTATVTKKSKKWGGIFHPFTTYITATVQVNNPSQQMVQGTLKVTFTNKGQAVETPEQPITLAPGGTQEYTLTSTKDASDATAYAEVIQNGTGTGTGTGTGWGTGTGTGTGWGTGTGTGTGTGWGTGY